MTHLQQIVKLVEGTLSELYRISKATHKHRNNLSQWRRQRESDANDSECRISR